MEDSEYKLSRSLIGHSEDVRAIASFENGTIISASRDKTARVWTHNRDSAEYTASEVLTGHNNFVSSVCVLNPTEKYSNSLIVTGSNDKHICIYILGESEPMRKIKAHEDTICCLRSGVEEGTFLSSSWDLSAKLWSLDDLDNAKLVLHGHSLAVWCVRDLQSKIIATGSADKLIIVWTRDGKEMHKLSGHTDCIRDISAINDNEFLSCANDATIRHWDALKGTCLGTYYGHENFIYSISTSSNGAIVVSSGEDSSIRVWKEGKVNQTILLPATSVWSVTILPNGDIAAGSSDGVIRIFSANSSCWANAEELKFFEDSAKIKANKVEVDKLPTISELNRPGTRDGQVKMFNENGKAVVYSWSANFQKWEKIGDVLGEKNETETPRQMHNGVAYDYVFTVDIQDGIPPLKLPYNKTDDPWVAAQKFINDHELSPMFLEQVANFLIKNTNASPQFEMNSEFIDPFTGGNRYVPGSGSSNTNPISSGAVSNAADPFTGGNRYIPKQNQAGVPPTNITTSTYIPHECYLKLEQANPAAILEKLKEFNNKQSENAVRLSDEQLDSAIELAKVDCAEQNIEAVNNFWKLLNWPDEFVFPVLDIARLAVLHKGANNQLCTKNLIPMITRHISPDALVANQMLTFRLLANMFHHESGEKLGLLHSGEILNALLQIKSFGNKNNQVAICTYVLNLIVALKKSSEESMRKGALRVMMNMLPQLKETEAVFRLLVAFGTLLLITNGKKEQPELVSLIFETGNVLELLMQYAEQKKTMSDPLGKVSKCAKEVVEIITS